MRNSPFMPGAGLAPPAFVGRDDLLHRWEDKLNRVTSDGRYGLVDELLVGPRGIGKTAAMDQMTATANRFGWDVVDFQAARHGSGLLSALQEHAEDRGLEGSSAWQKLLSGLQRVSRVDVSVAGLGVGVGTHAADQNEPVALNGNTLGRLLAETARSIRSENGRGGLLIAVDEMQIVDPPSLATVSAALHRINRRFQDSPVLLVGTGLPETFNALKRAGVTHPDRLYRNADFPVRLSPADTRLALTRPAQERGVAWSNAALDRAVAVTGGYPFHIQALGDAVWHNNAEPVISVESVREAEPAFIAEIDQDLKSRWEGHSAREQEYLAALSVAGGSTGSGHMGELLDSRASDLTRVRSSLIASGDVYAPRDGVVAMTMPIATQRVLAMYERSRAHTSVPLKSLVDLQVRQTEISGSSQAARPSLSDGP